MNKQEAIEYIKANYPDKYRYEGLCEALDLAIQTLKKQIPKKPTIVGHHYVCANCNTWILFDDEIPNKTDAYCCYCGQAQDWGEND